MSKKYYINENIGHGYERVGWLRPFDSLNEAQEYVSNSKEGTWDGAINIEEVEEED